MTLFFDMCLLFQVSEAVSAYHAGQAANQETMIHSHSTGSIRGRQSQEALGGLLTKVPVSNLCALTLTFVDSAHKLVGFREEIIMEAAHRVSTSSASDVQAVETVVVETSHLVNAIRHGRGSHSIPENCHVMHGTDGSVRGTEHGNEGKGGPESKGKQQLRSQRVPQDPKMLGTFLSSLARLFGALPDHHHHIWQSFRKRSTSAGTLGTAFEDLVHLCAIVWESEDLSNSEVALPYANDGDLGGYHGRLHGGSWQRDVAPTENCLCDFPWDPLLSLLSWGVVPVLTAEDSLLSCMQAAENPEKVEAGVGNTPGCCWGGRSSSRSLVAVATAVARGYHSLAVGEDLSTVLLTDLLGVAANSLTSVRAASQPFFRYHPMDLSRLVARLTIA